MNIQHAIAALVDGRTLAAGEIEQVFGELMQGQATSAQIGGLLIALRLRGETVAELVGAARAMRAHARPLVLQTASLLDTCGTGGDGHNTFNVSTAAAIVAAAAGARIAKHGNRAMSGRVGGADVLEHLGVRIDLEPDGVARCIDEGGIGFLFAQKFHPAMKHAAGPRRELGVRTIFNLLGPLSNPAGARRQLLGLFSAAWLEPVAEALRQLGSERALVVHGADGLDEISLSSVTHVVELADGCLRKFDLMPETFGLRRCQLNELQVESVEDSATAIRSVLAGTAGPHTDITLLNAGAALYVAQTVDSIAAGIDRARTVIESGAARAKLEQWVRLSQA